MIEALKIVFGIGIVWLNFAIGVAHFCAMTDAWDRTCRGYYMPPALRSSIGYKSMLVVAPVGFFIAMYFVWRMIRHPHLPPVWASSMLKR